MRNGYPRRSRYRQRRVGAALAVSILGVAMLGRTLAQDAPTSVPNMSPEQIQHAIMTLPADQRAKLQLLQQRQRQQQQPNAAAGEQPQTEAPVELTQAPAPPSKGPGTVQLEEVMSERAGHTLRLFGYDHLGRGSDVLVPQMGAVQEDYVLGPGDEIDVKLRGQESSDYTIAVDRNGQVVLPRLSPIAAAGRTLGDFRRDLVDAVHKFYPQTDAFASVGQLRQINVMVTGEVNNPGTRLVTGLSTPLDAILVSGGVKKSGSLRAIKVLRGDRQFVVDLYDVLTQRSGARLLLLQNGDRVFVPPIGATVAISGYVRRPAIYELPAGQQAISAEALVALGSGAVLRGVTTASVLRVMPDGKGQFVDVTGLPSAPVRDGEIMIVKAAVDISVGRVALMGAVRTPGAFAVDKYKTLHQILSSTDALQPGAFTLFGFIDRINQTTLQHEAIPFSPLHVIQGKEDVPLATDDTIHVLSVENVQRLVGAPGGQLAETMNSAAGTQSTAPAGAGTSGAATAGAVASGPGGSSNAAAGSAAGGESAGVAPAETAAAGSDAAVGAQFGKKLTDYRFTIGGAVHRPGTYLAAPNTTLAEALPVLGGLTDDVDLTSFELTSIVINNTDGTSMTSRKSYSATKDQLAALILQPYDQIVFHGVYSDRDSGSVMIEGQVRYPGQYEILRNERLSSLILRAGGLTDVAYPYGTVFLRKSVAQLQAEESQRTAADLRSQLFAVMMRPVSATQQAPSIETIAALQNLLGQIENAPALGRISIQADPALLAKHPDLDPILQPDDHVVIPKRPATISVLGEVMRPGAFPCQASMTVDDYIDQAGGYTQFADTSRVIVVLPDGRSRVAGHSWFGIGGSDELPPGTRIVVGRDIAGLQFHQLIVDTTQIVSQLATTAAALAVLTTNIK